MRSLIFETISECSAAASGNKTDNPPEGFICREEAADLLHIGCQTLAKRTYGDVFVAYRVGTRVLYKRAESIAALASATRRLATSEARNRSSGPLYRMLCVPTYKNG